VYVDLPPEDHEEGMCGKLVKAMYGTRDAAQNWELEYTEMLTEAKFKQGEFSPCVFFHEERCIRVVVHGDDFTILGRKRDLDWFRGVVQTKMEVKFKERLERGRPGAVRILNRIVAVGDRGLEYEADQRHAEIIMRDMGVHDGSKGLSTPGSASENRSGQGGHMKSEEQFPGDSVYRAVAARGNYLGQDRMDMQFAAKEISRFMSAPEPCDWRSAKRLARYLKDHKRVVVDFKYQEMPKEVVVWSDTDFAGCGKTRKSTSGGVVMLGEHCLKTYSQTQETIALSSGESEFYGIVKAASVGLGMRGLLKDLGVSVEVRVNTDSSAAKSISMRKGAGRVRHIEVRELWVQEKVNKGEIIIKKVKGESNVADGLTKHVDKKKMESYMEKCGFRFREGRHSLCPHLGD
jgi:hypothetical protein